jgi:hypothetical protein
MRIFKQQDINTKIKLLKIIEYVLIVILFIMVSIPIYLMSYT